MSQLFNPTQYIQWLDNGCALCTNPVADGGMSAITVNTAIHGERMHNFREAIRRMVSTKLMSPKFAEVILTATEMQPRFAQETA